MKSFAELFKKYRLRAEFETFAAFSNALADKGYFYEESIFSHWQKGTRIPTNRQLILKIIEIFVEKDSIKTINEANEFISSTGQGYLTEKEIENLHLTVTSSAPFQVPNDIVHFTGRKEILEKIKQEISHKNIFLFKGPAGVGKTSLAIRIGHILRDKFIDGVLWYKVDSSNVMDVLLSIARLFGEDISKIKDPEVRASVVRTLLEKKKVLLIFDNVTNRDNISLLLPNTPSCCVIFSSQENIFHTESHSQVFNLQTFTQDEVLELFKVVFNEQYVEKNKKIILTIGEKLGNLPLALHIAAHVIATYPKEKNVALQAYLEQLDGNSIDLTTLTYEDKNLYRAISIGFETLDLQVKNIFISLAVFDGKDFSSEAIASINNLSLQLVKQALEKLNIISFIDQSDNGRYRIHPFMKLFARKHMQDFSLYLRAALYYEQLLTAPNDKQSYKYLRSETDNIIYIFKKCYEAGYWDQVITLWNPIEKFLSDTNEFKKLRLLTQTIDTAPKINNFQKLLIAYMIFISFFWLLLFLSGLKTSFWNYLYEVLWNLIPFIGGFIGIFISKTQGFFSTNIGKARFLISAGIFSWGCGNIIWQYYNFFQNIDIPYPSFADLGYFSAGVLWIFGIIYLSRSTGAKFTYKQNRSKLFFLAIPTVLVFLSYYFLLFIVKRTFASDAPLKIFFDIVYPSMDIIILTFAIIIFGVSVNFFRGKYKLSLFAILGGFACLYIADFTFSYLTSIDAYYNGSPLEMFFNIVFFLLTWGTLSFYLTQKK